MAYLHRIALLLCFLLHAGASSAAVPAVSLWTTAYGNKTSTGATLAEACAGLVGAAYESPTGLNTITSASVADGSSCVYYYSSSWGGAYSGGGVVAAFPSVSCPSGSALSGGQCICSAGYTQIGDACQTVNEDRDRCAAFLALNTIPGGSLVQDYRLQGDVQHGAQFCMPGAFDNQGKGCKVIFDRLAYYGYDSGTGVTEGSFSGASDASTVDQSCTVGEGNTPPKVPTPEKCKDGYTGTVNGVEVCVSKKPNSGVSGPQGDVTSTDDGTDTTTRSSESRTECKDGNCTTTTTTITSVSNNVTGATTTSSSTTNTTQAQPNFCKENPASKLCREGDEDGSSFLGACTGGFTCEGDAIQCAIAREQHTRACKLFDTPSPESQLYDANKNKTGNQTGDLPGNETISLAGRIDTSDAIGGGGCIGNLNVTVMGTAVSLPLSDLCPYLAMLGNILIAVSMLLAARIVTRG